MYVCCVYCMKVVVLCMYVCMLCVLYEGGCCVCMYVVCIV